MGNAQLCNEPWLLPRSPPSPSRPSPGPSRWIKGALPSPGILRQSFFLPHPGPVGPAFGRLRALRGATQRCCEALRGERKAAWEGLCLPRRSSPQARGGAGGSCLCSRGRRPAARAAEALSLRRTAPQPWPDSGFSCLWWVSPAPAAGNPARGPGARGVQRPWPAGSPGLPGPPLRQVPGSRELLFLGTGRRVPAGGRRSGHGLRAAVAGGRARPERAGHLQDKSLHVRPRKVGFFEGGGVRAPAVRTGALGNWHTRCTTVFKLRELNSPEAVAKPEASDRTVSFLKKLSWGWMRL